MAANVPAKLKSADITRFAQRAAQVEKVKPPVAYWCYYWMVQTILTKNLHNQDDECRQYTTDLMDKLEEMKTANGNNDAITDDMAGQAYVEQFGLETFQRADTAMTANKVTRQTADTFQASATFLDLVNIWGKPNEEISSKIKYAKFHALRIAKALKVGEDPNASNPAPTPTPKLEDTAVLDPNDPEVQDLNKNPRYATVEDTIDDTDRLRRESAGRSNLDQSLHPSRDNSTARQPVWPPRRDDHGGSSYSGGSSLAAPVGDHSPTSLAPPTTSAALPVSPLAPGTGTPGLPITTVISPEYQNEELSQEANGNPRHNSVGGGYFPRFQLPAVPSDPAESVPGPSGPLSPSGYISPSSHPPANARDFYSNTSQPPVTPAAPLSPPIPGSGPPASPFQPPQTAPIPHQQQRSFVPAPAPTPQHPPAPSAPASRGPVIYRDDELAVLEAQKHAKWAISALNFEDVPTAVKELKEALHSLGAS